MIRTVVRLSAFSLPGLFTEKNQHDRDFINNPRIQEPQTGWERVKKIYSRNEYEEPSVELRNVAQATFFGCFVGACIGGFYKTKNAYVYFVETNQATIYKTPMDAKKKLQDYVTVNFGKGVVQWGWRLGLFTGLFSLISTTMSAYHNTTSLTDYVVAGTLTGALYKAHLGLAATAVGAALGAVLSTIGGLMILGILHLSGYSMDEIKRAMYQIKEAREDQLKQAMAKGSESNMDEITKHHDQLLKSKGEKKIEQM